MRLGKVSKHRRRPDIYQYRHCGKKIRFPSWDAAEEVAQTIGNGNGELLQPYVCEFCWAWHIGHFQDYLRPSWKVIETPLRRLRQNGGFRSERDV